MSATIETKVTIAGVRFARTPRAPKNKKVTPHEHHNKALFHCCIADVVVVVHRKQHNINIRSYNGRINRFIGAIIDECKRMETGQSTNEQQCFLSIVSPNATTSLLCLTALSSWEKGNYKGSYKRLADE